MPGRIRVDGYVDTGNSLRVSDDYSDSSPAVGVYTFWCGKSEEIKFVVVLLRHRDDKDGIELVWDGIVLKRGDDVVAR